MRRGSSGAALTVYSSPWRRINCRTMNITSFSLTLVMLMITLTVIPDLIQLIIVEWVVRVVITLITEHILPLPSLARPIYPLR